MKLFWVCTKHTFSYIQRTRSVVLVISAWPQYFIYVTVLSHIAPLSWNCSFVMYCNDISSNCAALVCSWFRSLTVSSVLKSDVFYMDCDGAHFGLSLGIFHFTVLQHCSSTSLCFQLVINFAWILQTKHELTLQRKSQSSCKLSAKLWYFFEIESSEAVFILCYFC